MKIPFLAVFVPLAFSTLMMAQEHRTAAEQHRNVSSLSHLEKEVRHELVMLPHVNVFDNLEFKVDGTTVTLMGQVTRPTIKSDAENVTKQIEGVGQVVNQIQVLPLSPNDDEIRLAVYLSLVRQPQLQRYFMQAMPPIRIIVNNGNLTLVGVIADQGDFNIANITAKGVPGVFAVTNNLRVEK